MHTCARELRPTQSQEAPLFCSQCPLLSASARNSCVAASASWWTLSRERALCWLVGVMGPHHIVAVLSTAARPHFLSKQSAEHVGLRVVVVFQVRWLNICCRLLVRLLQ